MRHQIATAVIALATIGAAFASERRGAFLGAAISGFTALGSILAMGRAVRGAKPMQRAIAVMAAFFLLRIVLVALGTWFIVTRGAHDDVIAFVVAFFVPYFVYATVEGLYLHALSHGTGPTA